MRIEEGNALSLSPEVAHLIPENVLGLSKNSAVLDLSEVVRLQTVEC